jgi:hypothetical protein
LLAATGDYIKWFQLPIFAIFVFGWLVIGGYLFQRQLSTVLQSRRIRFSEGLMLSLLSGSFGAFAGGAAFYAGVKLLGTEHMASALAVGLLLAVASFVVVAFLFVFVSKNQSFSKTIQISVLPIGATLVIGLLCGAAAFVPAYFMRQHEIEVLQLQIKTQQHMQTIYQALSKSPLNPPARLEELLAEEMITPEVLQSPANPSRAIGFIYHPAPLQSPTEENPARIILADYKDAYGEPIRMILYNTGETRSVPEAMFQGYLQDPDQAEFAKAVQQAEANK